LAFHFQTAVVFSSFSHRANRWRICPFFHAVVAGEIQILEIETEKVKRNSIQLPKVNEIRH
jgi:hypothetical protein